MAQIVDPIEAPAIEPTAMAEPTSVEERVQPARPLLAAYTGPEAIIAKIQSVFGNGELGREALCIAKMESGYRANAVNHNTNGTRDAGIFQLNDVHGFSLSQRLDPDFNIQKAYEIRLAWGNWSAWTTKSKCGL